MFEEIKIKLLYNFVYKSKIITILWYFFAYNSVEYIKRTICQKVGYFLYFLNYYSVLKQIWKHIEKQLKEKKTISHSIAGCIFSYAPKIWSCILRNRIQQ